MNSAKVILTILFLSSMFLPPKSVHADMSPPPASGIGGLAPFEYQATEVQMVFERVEMELKLVPDPSDPSDPTIQGDRIDVTAWFVMHNQGQTDESMQAVFPLSDFNLCRPDYAVGGVATSSRYEILPETFAVAINGTQVDTTTIQTDHPHASDIEACQGFPIDWAAFDVTFPVDQDVLVRVNYSMQGSMGGPGADSVRALEYLLETGAGWKGPIREGYVIFKFPYMVENEAVLTGTTPGFQKQQNEIYWNIKDLEPKESDNIAFVIVAPQDWLNMREAKETLKKDPSSSEAWSKLLGEYESIATFSKVGIRSMQYYTKIDPAYEEAAALNPSNPDLPANYAQFLFGSCCFYTPENFPASKSKILTLINKALALDPNNETVLDLLPLIESFDTSLTFTPPATIPPTATSLLTTTPAITTTVTLLPTPTERPLPSKTPIVATVARTRTVNAPTTTHKPEPTVIVSPTEGAVREERQNATSSAFVVFGVLLTFIAGIGVGIVWSRRPRV